MNVNLANACFWWRLNVVRSIPFILSVISRQEHVLKLGREPFSPSKQRLHIASYGCDLHQGLPPPAKPTTDTIYHSFWNKARGCQPQQPVLSCLYKVLQMLTAIKVTWTKLWTHLGRNKDTATPGPKVSDLVHRWWRQMKIITSPLPGKHQYEQWLLPRLAHAHNKYGRCTARMSFSTGKRTVTESGLIRAKQCPPSGPGPMVWNAGP